MLSADADYDIPRLTVNGSGSPTVNANPTESIDTLRDVRCVMKDGIFFKKDGVITPEKFFHGGPTPSGTWRVR